MASLSISSRRSRIGATVCALLLAAQLSACGGDNGGSPPSSSNPPPSNNNPPAPATVKLKLTGKVTDEPVPNAVVTATVGGETFTTTADATGAYSLDIEIDEGDVGEFVVLNARGVADQEFVELTSLAGSFQTLAAQAGDDDTLSSAENFSTQITNVSTAEAVLLREANGGAPVTSDAALASLGATLNGQDVLDLAAAIKLVVDHAADYPMPEGATSTLALVSDAAERKQLVADVSAQDPDAFKATQSAIAADPALSQPVNVQSVTDFTAAMLSTDAGFTFNYSNRVSSYHFEEDGTGSVSAGTFDQQMTWTVEGSTIRVTYAQPVETVSYDTESCSGDVRQVEAHYVSDSVTLTLLSDRTVAATETSDVTYADCAALEPREVTTTSARTILRESDFQVIDVDELRGGTQTIYVFDSALNAVVADIADIGADGTGTTRLTNQSFTWTVDSASRVITATFTDGTVAEYRSLRDIDELSSDLFYEIRTAGGAVYSDAGATVFADPEYGFELTADVVPGRFYQFGIGDETAPDDRLKGFRLRFDVGGTGAQEIDYIDLNGEVAVDDESTSPANAFHWTIENDSVVVRRTWDVAAQVDNCVFGNPNCVLYDERRIIPLGADGSRIYWIEQRRTATEGVTDSSPMTILVRFYDYEPLTGAATALATEKKVSVTRTLPPGAQYH